MNDRQRLREQYRRGCKRKRRYPDEIAAMVFVQLRQEEEGAPPLKTYRCQFCSGWHLAKVTPERKAA